MKRYIAAVLTLASLLIIGIATMPAQQLGIGTGLTRTSGSAIAGTVSNQNANFGEDTLASAGGFKPVDGSNNLVNLIAVTDQTGATRTWSINASGALVADGTPAVDDGVAITCSHAGPDSPVVLTIDTDLFGSGYSVSTFGANDYSELDAVFAIAGATLSGKTVRLRRDTYDLDAWNQFGDQDDLTSTVTVRADSDTVADMPVLNEWTFASNTGTVGNVHFHWVDFYREHTLGGNEIILIGNGVDAENIEFHDCMFRSNFGEGKDDFVPTNVDMAALTVERHCAGIVIEDCTCHSMGIAWQLAGDSITCRRNICYNMWGDCYRLFPGSQDTNTTNVLLESTAFYWQIGDQNSRHGDFLQAFARGGQTGDVTDVEVRGNIVFPGNVTYTQPPGTLPGATIVSVSSSPYNVTTADDGKILEVDASGGAITITFDAATTLGSSHDVTITKIDSSTNGVTLDPNGSETVDGATTQTIDRQWDTFGAACDGVSAFVRQPWGNAITGLIIQSLNGGSYARWKVHGNLFYVTGVGGISFEIANTSDVLVRNNTLIRPWTGETDINGDGQTYASHGASAGLEDNFYPYAAPQILIAEDGNSYTIAEYNSTEGVAIGSAGGSPLFRNNVTNHSRLDKTTYTDDHVGTTLFPETTTAATSDARIKNSASALDADSSGTITVGDIGAVGLTTANGYWDFDTNALSSTFDSPELWNAGNDNVAETTVDIRVNTNDRTGTLYYVITQSATQPTEAQIRAGQDHTSTAADDAGTVTGASLHYGTNDVAVTGLTNSTTYYTHWTQRDSDTNDSGVESSGSFTTAAPSVFEIVTFDGANDYLTQASGPFSDGEELSIVFRCQLADDTTTHFYMARFGTLGWIRREGGQDKWRLTISGKIDKYYDNTTLASAGMKTVFLSVKTTSGQEDCQLWIDDTQNNSAGTNPSSGAMDLTPTTFVIGADNAGTWPFSDDVEFFWADDTYIDFSVQANRDDFDNPTTLGATGDGPTGADPLIYFTGEASVWNAGTNQGTGGNFTMNGAVVDN